MTELNKIDYDKVSEMTKGILDYSKTLTNADRIRLAAYAMSLVDAIQQNAKLDPRVIDDSDLFSDVDEDDITDLGYHLHHTIENLADDLDELAGIMERLESDEE